MVGAPGGGGPSVWKLFPTESLRDLYLKRCLRERRFNYYVGWRDVGGFGLHGAWASWVGEGRPYVNL